jgi:hypothetical protein
MRSDEGAATFHAYLRFDRRRRSSHRLGEYLRLDPAAVALTVASAYGGRMDVARSVVCASCGGDVAVVSESTHPCGIVIQLGRCAECYTMLRRLLDERRVPVADALGQWTAAATGVRHSARRVSHLTQRATRTPDRPAGRTDSTRPC